MKLKKITLAGFKGISRIHDLTRPLVLFGENGSGKSAVLQAVHYALSGEVPTGKALDAVASFFPPHGGWVTLELESGEWIQRGIEIDAEKKKNSELLKIEGDESHFRFAPAVLDIQNFLSLSASARRDFIMELVSATAKNLNLLDGVTDEFAKAIGGKAAESQWLLKSKEPPAQFYHQKHGILDHLRSIRTEGLTLGGICNLYIEESKTQKLVARRRAAEAKAAIRELEPEAEMKKNMAAALPAAKEAEAALKSKAGEYSTKLDLLEKRRQAVEEAQQRLGDLDGRVNSINLQEQQLKKPDDPPPPTKDIEDLQATNQKIGALKARADELEGYLDAIGEYKTRLIGIDDSIDEESRRLGIMKGDPSAKLAALIEDVPDTAHSLIPKIKGLAKQALVGIMTRMAGSREELANLDAKKDEVIQQLENAEQEDAIMAELAAVRAELLETEKRYADIFKQANEYQAGYKEAIRTRDARIQARRAFERTRTELLIEQKRAAMELETRVAEEEALLIEIEVGQAPSVMGDDPNGLDTQLRVATLAREEAERAAGAYGAYEQAIESARAAMVEEEAWKVAEGAVKAVRERFVGATTAGLLGDLQAFWTASGRTELAYLLLENERGKAIFELGLLRGEERIALGALSEAEQLLFTIALAYTITKRTKDLKVLLIEADPLLHQNFNDLILWLCGNHQVFDGVVIAKGDAAFSEMVDGAVADFRVEVLS